MGIQVRDASATSPIGGYADVSGKVLPDGTAALRIIAVDATGAATAVAGGTSTTSIAAGVTANTIVKNGPGRLTRVLTTSLNGATAVSIYDSATTATGTIIGFVPANAVAGTTLSFDMPAAIGIVVGGAATNPSMTVSFF